MRTLYSLACLFLFMLAGALTAAAQQLPDRSPFADISYIWNPAMTAKHDYWDLAASHRQQWLGFADAPQTSVLAFQHPFREWNTSFGAYFIHDRTHPLQSSMLGLNYAYTLRSARGKGGSLSLGLTANIQQFMADGLDLVVSHPDDDLLPRGEFSTLVPNAGVGAYYVSRSTGGQFEKPYFFAGLAANQLFTPNVRFRESGALANFERAIHANAVLGMHSLINALTFLESSIWVHYSSGQVLNAQLQVVLERQDAFWAGFTFHTHQTLALQLGYIVAKGLPKDATLRIGAAGTYNVGTFGPVRGLGYEAYVAYRFYR